MRMIDLFRKSKMLSNSYALLSFYQYYFFSDHHKSDMKRLLRLVRPYTMASYRRLRNVYELAESMERDGIKGDFVECGVWRGGCAGILAYVSKRFGSNRTIHLFDSFEGLPDPSREDGQEASLYMDKVRKGKYAPRYKCEAPLESVKKLFFEKLKVSPERVHFHRGWFDHTIPLEKAEIDKIAILRLDADWYESTKVCLAHLYDKVVPGGFVILDDYGYWEGCRKATDEFFKERDIHPTLNQVDPSGYYFVKSS